MLINAFTVCWPISFESILKILLYAVPHSPWVAQSVVKNSEAVTFLIYQTVELKSARMDKTHVIRRELKKELSY